MINKKIRVFQVGNMENGIIPDKLTMLEMEKLIRSTIHKGGEIQLFVPPFVTTYEIEMQVPDNESEKKENLRIIKTLDQEIKALKSKNKVHLDTKKSIKKINKKINGGDK